VRIAVAGAGLIGHVHARLLGGDLCAVVDPAPAGAEMAAAAGVPRYAAVEELLARDRPDGVVLATPNALHVPQALQCIAAGVAVLVEKPVAATVAEAERLVREAEKPGARVLVGHHRAHSPIMAKAKQIVDSGVLGRIVAVMGSALYCKPDDYFEQGPWRREPGGGPILINLIHDVHNLRMLCGEVVAVQAFASSAARGFAVEDTAAISLRFAGGALGSFLLSDAAASARSWEQTSGEDPAFPFHDDEDCYLLCGTDGSLALPTLRLRTYPSRAERSWKRPFRSEAARPARADPMALQAQHFRAVARGEAAPLVTARDGLANLRVTEAVVAAARDGGTVLL
jgi:predicted dehydrogenase